MLLPSNRPAIPFSPEESVRSWPSSVIGGLGAVAGPVLGAIWVVGIPAFWPNEPIGRSSVSGVGHPRILLFVLPRRASPVLDAAAEPSSAVPSPELRRYESMGV